MRSHTRLQTVYFDGPKNSIFNIVNFDRNPLTSAGWKMPLKGLERQFGRTKSFQTASKQHIQVRTNVPKEETHYSLVIGLGCNAFILAKRSEKTVNCTFQNHRHFECEIPRDLTLKVKGRAMASEYSNQTWQSSLCSVWFRSTGFEVHRVTHIEKFPVRISNDEAPTPLPTVGPLFIY